jgi:hypothetical protein
VVLRELYPREGEEASLDAEGWWDRFEAELQRDPEAPPATAAAGHQRRVLSGSNAPAAVAGELASCGESVVAVAADAAMRAAMVRDGLRLTDYAELERMPALCAGFTHVVLVDPPPNAALGQLLSVADEPDGYLHRAWGEAEWRFAVAALSQQLMQRPALIALFRDLREAGETSGVALQEALIGGGRHPRGPEAAARGFRVLSELGLVQGAAERGLGKVRIVSSEETDLERSAAFRAFDARYQEALRYLEGQRQP